MAEIKIEHYEFGKIIINQKIYTSDIKIFAGKIIPNWWRKEGHCLCIEDIKDLLETNPQILIVGCGANSMMKVLPEVTDYCKQNNIQLYSLDTVSAVKKFNLLYPQKTKMLAGCFHLTC